MDTRTVYLISYRQQPRERAHFALFIPYNDGTGNGIVIHVVGTPMSGYGLEFKRRYNLQLDSAQARKVRDRHRGCTVGLRLASG